MSLNQERKDARIGRIKNNVDVCIHVEIGHFRRRLVKRLYAVRNIYRLYSSKLLRSQLDANA